MISSSSTTAADGRWALLRAALSGRSQAESSSTNSTTSASIHSFPGWKLIEKRPCCVLSDAAVVECSNSRSTRIIKHEILGRQCMGGDKGSFRLKFSTEDVGIEEDELKSLREDLGRCGILARLRGDDKQQLHVQWSYSSYVAMEYHLFPTTVLRVRERKLQRKVSLTELMSHARHQGVDNTGQTCVWDSESTLTYCLTRESSSLRQALHHHLASSSSLSVMEVGAGMAGLAGMALAKLCGAKVLLTDGHPVAVENNQINIRMNELEDSVQCEQLLWSTDIAVHKEEFDLVLCSDCTHFVEHHAGLLITLAHVLRVGGVAVLCQPSRTGTLERFLSLCQELALWKVEALAEEDVLKRCHQDSLSDPTYDPNLHCPRIVLLTKERSLSLEDCQRVIELHQQKIELTSAGKRS